LQNVLYVPKLGVNLLSLGLITSKGATLFFNKHNCTIHSSNGFLLARSKYKEGISVFYAKSSDTNSIRAFNTSTSRIEETEDSDLDLIDPDATDNREDLGNYNLESNSSSPNDNTSSNSNKEQPVVNDNTIELLHKGLGHINLKAIKKLKDNAKGVTLDLEDIDTASTSLDNCEICIQAKLTKNISKLPSTKVSSYLDLFYIDIGGPIKPKTFGGYKYYITFRDSYTKYLVVKLLKSRKDIIAVIKTVITELELEAKNNSSKSSNSFNNNNKVKVLQLDNEFISSELEAYLAKKGIDTRYSPPYTKEPNGAAEIVDRILFNKVRALLINSNLPLSL
jgi:hypothetical protein